MKQVVQLTVWSNLFFSGSYISLKKVGHAKFDPFIFFKKDTKSPDLKT